MKKLLEEREGCVHVGREGEREREGRKGKLSGERRGLQFRKGAWEEDSFYRIGWDSAAGYPDPQNLISHHCIHPYL